MTFQGIAFRNLLRHRTRNLLTMAGIALSVAVLFSIISFNRGFERGLKRELERSGIHFMVVPSGCPHEVASLVLHGAVIPKYLGLESLAGIKEQPGIELASPILVSQLPNRERNRVDLIYGIEMEHLNKLKPQWQLSGSIPQKEDEVIIGASLAEHDRLKPGDAIRYASIDKTFRVAAVLARTGSQDDAFIYMPVGTSQRIFNKPQGATAIGVRVIKPGELTTITDNLSEKIPGIQIVTMGQIMNSLSSLANSAKVLSVSIAIIAVLISAAGVMNTILMSIFERTQEIGMMRAIGASRPDIFRIIIIETIVLTTLGGLAGVAVSTGGAGIIELLVRRLMPYVPSGSMIVFDPMLAALSLLFSLCIGIASGVYPAWKASGITPIEAIRG